MIAYQVSCPGGCREPGAEVDGGPGVGMDERPGYGVEFSSASVVDLPGTESVKRETGGGNGQVDLRRFVEEFRFGGLREASSGKEKSEYESFHGLSLSIIRAWKVVQ